MQLKKNLKRIVLASDHSLNGLMAAIHHEVAFRQELMLFTTLSIITFLVPVTVIEQTIMLSTFGLVLIVELLNSALECLSDRITSEWDPLIKRAKDYGSLAVLISLSIATAIWLVILVPKLGLFT